MRTLIRSLVTLGGLLLFLRLFAPWLRKNWRAAKVDDSLQIRTVHPYRFDDVEIGLATRIREAINLMGGVGEGAEETYQKALRALAGDSERVVDAIRRELRLSPELRPLDRWALIQLLAELRDPSAVPVLDDLLSREVPAERSKDPHGVNTLRREAVNLTTAVEALTRIAAAGDSSAVELLRKHVSHPILSVRRACIQAYLAHGGDRARDELVQALPEQDRYLLDIRRIDVRDAPPVRAEPGPTRQRKAQEVADVPRATPRLNV